MDSHGDLYWAIFKMNGTVKSYLDGSTGAA